MSDPTPPARLSQQHFAPLDGLRALAILLVIPHNVDLFTGPASPVDLPALVYMHAGWIGVQLFFVLSGFLITGGLLDTRGASNYFQGFYIRRALRIFPLYFAILTAVLVLLPLFVRLPPPLTASLHNQVWLWTFLSNWTAPFDGGVYGFGHFWSLAVEEQFYLLWPFVVACCTPRQLLKVCAALILGALGVRIGMEIAHARPEALYQFTICRMDALAAGAAAAAVIRLPLSLDWLRVRTTAVSVGALVLLLGAALATRAFSMNDPGTQTLGYTVLALGFALAVLAAILPPTGMFVPVIRVLSSRPLSRVARYSYGMYVIHLPLHLFVGIPMLHRLFPGATHVVTFSYDLIMVVASLALAALSYELFEKRFLALKSRLAPSGGAPAGNVSRSTVRP